MPAAKDLCTLLEEVLAALRSEDTAAASLALAQVDEVMRQPIEPSQVARAKALHDACAASAEALMQALSKQMDGAAQRRRASSAYKTAR